MPEVLKMEEEVVDALRQLNLETSVGPSDRSQARARRAMIAAVAARQEGHWLIRFLRRPLRPRSVIAELAVLTVAAIAAIGWSAPAGTPFHGVRLARETIVRSLSGENRLDMDLNFVEQYLAEAARNEAPLASEAEARLYLDDARSLLPANLTDPSWQRWRADENELAALTVPQPQFAAHASPAPRRAATSPKPSASASINSGDRGGADDEEHASPRPSTSPSPQASPQPSPRPSPDR